MRPFEAQATTLRTGRQSVIRKRWRQLRYRQHNRQPGSRRQAWLPLAEGTHAAELDFLPPADHVREAGDLDRAGLAICKEFERRIIAGRQTDPGVRPLRSWKHRLRSRRINSGPVQNDRSLQDSPNAIALFPIVEIASRKGLQMFVHRRPSYIIAHEIAFRLSSRAKFHDMRLSHNMARSAIHR